jgi:hypothetical protein
MKIVMKNTTYLVQWQNEPDKIFRVQECEAGFAVHPPENASFADVKQLVCDLCEYLGKPNNY